MKTSADAPLNEDRPVSDAAQFLGNMFPTPDIPDRVSGVCGAIGAEA
jgi:hypothetical protein